MSEEIDIEETKLEIESKEPLKEVSFQEFMNNLDKKLTMALQLLLVHQKLLEDLLVEKKEGKLWTPTLS